MADIIQEPLKDGFPAEETVEAGGGVTGVEQTPVLPGSPEQRVEKSEVLYQKIIAQVQTSASDDTKNDETTADLDAKAIMALEDMKVQVERLVQLAELKGVVYAVNVAKKLDFYVLDQVHDRLANHLYDTLLSKGMIEKE